MTSIPFHSIKGFSSLFRDFTEGKGFIQSRFPNQNFTGKSEEELLQIARRHSRNTLEKVLSMSMQSITLTDKQKSNRIALLSDSSFAIVTGQQVGFLGGPLYTFYKIATAISKAESLSLTYKNIRFVPVFWVEDNDHDREEAAISFLPDKTGAPTQYMCPSDETIPHNTVVSSLVLSESITTVLNTLEEQLPDNEFSKEFMLKVRKSYTPGTEWSIAFINLLQDWFGDKGLLFIRASEARKTGVFKNIVIEELSSPEKTLSLVSAANMALQQNGYDSQAQPSSVNLFYHTDTIRTKITFHDGIYKADTHTWSKEQLEQEAHRFPERFSPNVLLRPLCQDSLLPTFAYIAGPGEIAYLAQLCECYDGFGVRMPIIIPRHSATLLLSNHKRLLEKSEKPIEFYLRPFAQMEQDLSSELDDGTLSTLQTSTLENFAHALYPLGTYAKQTDASLEGSFGALQKTVNDSVETFIKKIKAAQKRKEQTVFERTKTLAHFLFPESKAQERVYGIGALCTKTTEQTLFDALDSLTSMAADKHYIISITH